MRKLKSCGFLVFRAQPGCSFLLMRHPHRYDLPKGHVEEGETELECALRELQEETGITHEQIRIDPEFKFEETYHARYKRFRDEIIEKTVVIFIAWLDASGDQLKLTEHRGYEWFDWCPPHRIQKNTVDPLLEAVQAYFEKRGLAPL